MRICQNCKEKIKKSEYHIRDMHMVIKGEDPYRYYCSINCFLLFTLKESPMYFKYLPNFSRL